MTLGNGQAPFDWASVVPVAVPEVDPAVYAAQMRQAELQAAVEARKQAQATAERDAATALFEDGFQEWDRGNLSLDELDQLPPQLPLIKGNILYQGTTVWIAAQWGSYKTFVALDMALSIATGHRWLGRETIRGGILYVAGEGVAGLKKRKQAWLKFHGHQNADAIAHVRGGIDFTNEKDRVYLKHAASLGRYSLIVLDTQARVLPGVDENSVEALGEFVKEITEIATKHNTTVMVVHHAGKDLNNPMRGSTSIPGAADSIFLLRKDTHSAGIVTMEVHKHKDTEIGEEILITMERVVLGLDEDGQEISSLVPTIGELRDYAIRREGDDTKTVQRVASIALGILAQLSTTGTSKASFLKALRERMGAQHLETEHITPERALADLLDAQLAVLEDRQVIITLDGKRRLEWLRGLEEQHESE